MDFQGNFEDLGALEDFANDTHCYGSDDDAEDSDDRCSYDEDLDPGHIDAQLSQAATQGKPDPEVLAMLVASNRENGDGEEHLEASQDHTSSLSTTLKKKILPPTMALAFFDDDDDADLTSPPSPFSPISPNNNAATNQPRPVSLHEELESFNAKFRHQRGTQGSSTPGSYSGGEGSFSSDEDDEPELLALRKDGIVTTPEDIVGRTPAEDPFNDASAVDDEWEWENSDPTSTPPMLVEPIPEYTASEELEEERSWRTVQTADGQFRIDMKVIDPYKKVLSHGGYYGDGFNAIVVFNACFLPDRSRHDYHYVMDNLFLYVVSTLEMLVVEDYMLLFFHGGTPKSKMPGFRWLRRCYQMIDRRLRKNLKKLVIVHPTLWLRTVMTLTRPLISAKFSAKVQYIRSLQQLHQQIPTEFVFVPDEVKAYDATMTGRIASYSQTKK